ncbi:dual specificity protein phosphatase PHS1 [Trifolium repens]|nr:dual specificity protein phosphatase PHS1 [Trifolium repens]
MVTYGGMSKKHVTVSTSAFIFKLTINSGGVASFALFNVHGSDDASLKEAAAVIKISSSRMTTQSECLRYEFAKWLGVQTPQARVIHNTRSEWL